MANTMTTREALLKAAEHLEQYGWRQNGSGHRGAPCCAAGAIDAVTLSATLSVVDHDAADGAMLALGRLLRLSLNAVDAAIAQWNDAPGRTADEVIAALRAAAEACNG